MKTITKTHPSLKDSTYFDSETMEVVVFEDAVIKYTIDKQVLRDKIVNLMRKKNFNEFDIKMWLKEIDLIN